MKTKFKNAFILLFYIFATIGILDMASHAVGSFCINPLNYIVKGIKNESK